jgi:GxxExxY protein
MSKLIHAEISNKVLSAAFTVHSAMGPGLLEAAYEGAMIVELAYNGIPFERQKVYPLEYRGEYIGVYIADIVVENTIIIELKAVARLSEVMEAQLLNYLKISKLPVGYLFNFYNTSLSWRRLVN